MYTGKLAFLCVKNMFNKFKAGLLIVAMLLLTIINSTSVVCSYADTIEQMQQEEQETQNAISALEKQTEATRNAISSLQQQKTESEANMKNLKNQSDNLKSTYNAYSSQLNVLSGEIADAEEKLRVTSGEIVALNNELMENQRQEKELYEKLKLQLKASYEIGINKSIVFSLLSSKSIRDFLNRAEYINALVGYQQKLLKQYKEVEADIEAQAAVLEEKQAQLDSYQAQLDDKQDALSELADSVVGELNATNASISSEKDKQAAYASQLTELDSQMKALEASVAAAQAKLAQQIAARLAAQEAAGKKENTGGAYSASGTELEWLAATIQAEAGGESYTGKLAVGSVIMNRVMSSNFPNSIQGVITQNMQFASYRSGKVELIMSRGINSTCLQAAREVLDGARVGDYLFFMTKYYADYYGIAEYNMIGNHAFFYKWVTKPKEVVEEQPSDDGGSNDDSSSEESHEETTEESNDESSSEDSSSEDSGEE